MVTQSRANVSIEEYETLILLINDYRDAFESALQQEEKDRIRYHDDALNPIRAQVKGITDGLVKEKKTRIANERQIVADIDRECAQMHTDI